MELNDRESTFINMIKFSIIKESKKYGICPSIIASIAIIESNWGTDKIFHITKNIFKLPSDNKWYGKIYSKDTGIIYNTNSECDEIGSLKYRVYSSHQLSIIDFIYTMMNCKRSNNGPLKYGSIINCLNYKDSIDKLYRSDFFKDFINNKNDFIYSQTMVKTIERYGLYQWDNYLMEEIEMSKKKKKTINNKSEILENVEHIYRVRLDWDKPDTQIFSSPDINDAREEALKHEGYKIYIDNGDMFEDPWKKEETDSEYEENTTEILGLNIAQIIPGKQVILKNVPIYRYPFSKTSFITLSGIFYLYDSTITNGMVKITKCKNRNIKIPDPTLIFGYIKGGN